MPNIYVPDEPWSRSKTPLGVLERWRVRNGERVERGQAVAEVRVDDALHELVAPCSGRMRTFAEDNDLVAPGALIGRIEKPAVH